jgi:hypothetical protein
MINVYRIYDYSTSPRLDDPENYIVSLIATSEGAQYVYPTSSTLDLGERIQMIADALKRDGDLPTTPDGWSDLAIYNIGLGAVKVLVLEIPEDASIEVWEVEQDEIAYLDEVLVPEIEKAVRS